MTNTVDSVGTLSGVDNAFIKPSGTFKGNPYFDCDHDTFAKCLKGKKKGGHWNSYLGKSELSTSVKHWLKTSKNKNFLLRSTTDGSFVYANKAM